MDEAPLDLTPVEAPAVFQFPACLTTCRAVLEASHTPLSVTVLIIHGKIVIFLLPPSQRAGANIHASTGAYVQATVSHYIGHLIDVVCEQEGGKLAFCGVHLQT